MNETLGLLGSGRLPTTGPKPQFRDIQNSIGYVPQDRTGFHLHKQGEPLKELFVAINGTVDVVVGKTIAARIPPYQVRSRVVGVRVNRNPNPNTRKYVLIRRLIAQLRENRSIQGDVHSFVRL